MDERIRFSLLNQEGGLSSDRVFGIVQDRERIVWLATDTGLNRFDGYVVKQYLSSDSPSDQHLSSQKLTSIVQSGGAKNRIWIGTADKGLNLFNPETEKFTWITRNTPQGKYLHSDKILKLAISGDRKLWIGTDKGLNVLDLEDGAIRGVAGELGAERISTISVLNGSDVWVGTEKGGLFRWNETSARFNRIWQADAPISAISIDKGDRIWVGTGGDGLHLVNVKETFSAKKVSAEVSDVTSIACDKNDTLWVGSAQGLLRMKWGAGIFTLFAHNPRDPDSLSHNHVTSVFPGEASMLWVTTQEGGVCRFSLEQYWFPHVRMSAEQENGLPDSSITSFFPSRIDNKIWIGTRKGIVKWNPANAEVESPFTERLISSSLAQILMEDSLGRMWIGTKGNGLIRRDRDGKVHHFLFDQLEPQSLPHNFVNALHQQSKGGKIWIGTYGGGVALFDEKTQSFRKAILPSEQRLSFVSHIAEDSSGTLWFAGKSGLMVHFPIRKIGKAGQKPQPIDPALLPLAAAFPNLQFPDLGPITNILPDRNGIVWVGSSDSGILQMNVETGDTVLFSRENTKLPSNYICGASTDKNGNLWISTPKGIARFDPLKADFRIFTSDDGLQKGGFFVNSIGRGQDDTLYFGGADGFNMIFPDRLPALVQPPIPLLTRLDYFGEEVKPGDHTKILKRPLGGTAKITIPFDPRNQIGFQFANVGSRFPTRGKFRYMLKPLDEKWSIAGSDRRASYTGLRAGEYKFVVQSSPNGKDWPENTASVSIEIPQPWFLTLWFRLLVIVIVIVGTVSISQLVIRSRIRHAERRQAELKAQCDNAEAALARELQNSLLIEKTADTFREGIKGGSILGDSLRGFAEQFGATNCVIQQLCQDEEGKSVLKLVAHYNGSGQQESQVIEIDADLPFSKAVLDSDEVVFFDDIASIPERMQLLFAQENLNPLTAIRTNFADQPNGIIILQRMQKKQRWDEEEVRLLTALSDQFGIAIAQITAEQRENEYRDHLKEAKHHAEVANRAKSDFLAKMTHELRTPLNAIIGFTEIIREEKDLTERQRELINIVNGSGEHLLDVINEILDLSKIEAGKLEKNEEAFELIPLLRSVFEMLSIKAREKNIGFDFNAVTALPGRVLTDRSKVRQTLINLLGNAIKFTESGSVKLSVGASVISDPEEKGGQLCRRVRLNFEIEDTGKGIADEELPKLFENYSQTESGRRSSQGTGLGLPIARSFVKLMGGDIQVQSSLGEGTTFRFYVECDEIAQSESDGESVSRSLTESMAQKINGFTSELEDVRILIVEDQPTNRLLLRKILGKAGFTLGEATNGQEALDQWESWKPHLILMDEDMPVMRGTEATRAIRTRIKEENSPAQTDPVIVSLTAYALDQAKESAFEAGVQDFVAKPFRSHELFSVISKHLGVEYTFSDVA